jgi:hypothetical protein
VTVAADQRCCSQIWVVAGVVAEIAAEIAAEVVAEVAAEIAAEVAAEVVGRTELEPDCGSGDP